MQLSVSLDTAQQAAAVRLRHISECLNNHHHPAHGCYLFGPVGRGKSMLMDAFFASVQITQKKRVHFHHFMKMVHQALNSSSGKADPLRHIAADWASQTRVLCLDEFMVEDIADAMLLGTLMRYLFELDVTLVTTSNTAIEDLYKNGLHRDRFLPAIKLLQQHCEAVWLDGGKDYRRLHTSLMPYYQVQQNVTQRSESAGKWVKHTVEALTGSLAEHTEENIQGRPLPCLYKNQRGIIFDFTALCKGPRSQRDYMELTEHFKVIGVENVPCFSFRAVKDTAQGVEDNYRRPDTGRSDSQTDNEARRFIALVDECYDRGCLLVMTAQALPDGLYQAEKLRQVFERCTSRLYEMQRWTV